VKNSTRSMPTAPKSAGPTYYDLIKAAIIELKDRNGSSRQAINKYVAAKKGAGFMKHVLNRVLASGVESGKLVAVKGSFKLSAAEKKPAKKAAPKKRPAAKKATATKKRAAPKKKTATKKRASPKKKTATKKRAAPKKRTAAKKRAAPKKRTAAKKRAAPKKKSASKKK